MRGPIRGQFTGHVITPDQSEAKLREKRGDRAGGAGGRLKGSNHKEQEQRRFVGTPWTLGCLVIYSKYSLMSVSDI